MTCVPCSGDTVVVSLNNLCKRCKAVVAAGSSAGCYTLLPSVELSDSESVSDSLLESGRKKTGESCTENMTRGTMRVNTRAFQALTYRAELNLAPCRLISAKTWVSCVSVHFSLTVFSAAGSGSLASFSHRWGRSLISSNPPG